MDLQTEKLNIIRWLTTINDQNIISKFLSLKKQEEKNTDWWEELSDTDRQAIDEGLKGLSSSYEEIRETLKKQYGI